MKYENYSKVTSIVMEIDKYKAELLLIKNSPDVRIEPQTSSIQIFTIGTQANCEHRYAVIARQLIETIKSDLEERIDGLKDHLKVL